ncbi:uncharacterized protein LOC111254399 [Varroa destructor]|uniref:Uncharacterized protein n=1 Tax=Varroa destructor TaxID=109461 RepID=A0A7M7KRM1_VARDE|nr:uncharacterized protein LOC111254399 [Varroa destructor]
MGDSPVRENNFNSQIMMGISNGHFEQIDSCTADDVRFTQQAITMVMMLLGEGATLSTVVKCNVARHFTDLIFLTESYVPARAYDAVNKSTKRIASFATFGPDSSE